MKQLTFEDVCKQLKRNRDFSGIADDVSALSGATILLLGIRSASGDISAFLNALMIKDQLINIGKCVLDKIIKERSNECDKRINQMQWAYSIIYYTAFFDVLDEQMPEQMRKVIGLSLKEKKGIFQNVSLEKMERKDSLMETEILFPNIVYGYANITLHLEKLYRSMCDGLIKFVHMLSFEETSSEQTISEFQNIVKELPQLAMKRFQGQYLYLASNFNEFYIYIQMEEQKIESRHIEELYKNIISVGCDTNRKIDVGLENLEKILLNLPEKIHEDKVNNIVSSLLEKYKSDVDKPIIESKSNDEKLKYPSINRAFIPQSYKILEYSGTEKLEKKDTWRDLKECSNMDSFWAKYCISHYSLENLLLILGEPGGGKSLLTKIICARMSDRSNIFVRIPLREVSVEKEIEDIVCEQIKNDGDATEPLPTYKWFAENFKYNPITLMFDGYDEVLQATGGVYRNLLKKILKFQDQCAERHRPVRIVVTSRETLIDKADIPVGTVVLKLLEFNENQRDEWINIWNQNNDEIFRNEHINSFMLPKNNSSIDELSRQPLLLLMLAIYDANLEEGINSLGQEEKLNRTKLYNELLRRFIRRELRKGPRGDEVSYEDSAENEKEMMENQELEKLGIAALGMFIRGKLSLKVSEMEKDLIYMESQTPTYKSVGKMLSNAEEFFGSFFFIHDSQSGNTETKDKEIAFEFLHKTFYEFLVADLVLKYLIKAIDELDALKNSKRSDSYRKAIDEPNHFDKQYYTALMSAYLCAEPEIIEMIVEWKENVINDYFQGERLDYDKIIEELFNKQVERLCNNIFMPSIWIEQPYDNKTKKSYMQYCAIYFMNLLILQTITKKDSKQIITKNDWIYISQFWKMNIQEDVLLKFTSLFSITNESEGVCIKKKHVLSKVEQKNLLERQKDIFNFLQDEISYELYSLHDVEIQSMKKQKYRNDLLNKGIDVEFELLLGEINEFILGNSKHFSIKKNIKNGIRIISQYSADASVVLDWMLCVNNCLERVSYHSIRYGGEVSELVNLLLHEYPENIQIISEGIKCCRKTGDMEILFRKTSVIWKIIENLKYENPKLLLEYSELLEPFLSIDKKKMLIESLKELLYKEQYLSVEILKKLYLISANTGFEGVKLDDLLCHIVNHAEMLYHNSPKTMIDILKLYIMQGRSDDVNYLVKIGLSTFFRNFLEQPEFEIEFLEVTYLFKETQQYIIEIFYYIDKEFARILYKNPKIIRRILNIYRLLERQKKYKKLIPKLYKLYDTLFDMEPKEAIELLKMTMSAVSEKYFKRALEYSVDGFNYLVKESSEAAVDLLILCNNVIIYDKCHCFRIFFDYSLYNKATEDIKNISKLFKLFNSSDFVQMENFFSTRYLYILINFPDLAVKIAEIYCNSELKRIFRDALLNYEQTCIVDREYILHLRTLWQMERTEQNSLIF